MAVNNEYVNRVDANGQTLIDLTNDTATAGDVLEGRTLHLASGAPATGTYRPSDEIEARLEATVGHSSKNLFKPIYRQGTVGNVNTTSSVCCRIVINTTNGATHRFKCFDNSFAFRVYGLNEAGKQQLLSWENVTSPNRLFDSDYIFSDTYEHTNDNSNIVAYAIMLRKTSTPGQEAWIDITPSDVPNNIFMVVESPLTIDTFEPYVTPTDEKKQDKPVFLDTSILSWNIDELISQYAYLQFVFMDMQATSSHLFDIATVPTSHFTHLPASQPSHVFGFSSIIAIRALGSTTGTSYITFNLYIDGTIEMSNTYTPLAPYLTQIIGIPK